ncbi:MAG: CPBP family intramembrane glutamic endopeptidase [Pseudomonadota bacterium]|nr:CPBP family intramembrane glutamic endopeptidase [Pseudomonadota bacterium]
MRETGIFFLYLVVCLVLGALLTYPVMQTGWIESDPHRVMGRLAQVFILLGLWPFLKATGLNNRAALGFGTSRSVFLRGVGRGWLMGVAILALLALTLVMLQIRVPDPLSEGWVSSFLKKGLQALIGGLLIGLLEETFFRGALFSAIRRRGGMVSAVAWTAALYALLHFMKPHGLPDGVAFDWAGSWQMFVHVFTGVFQWKHLDSMFALFLVGVFLGLVRERTGHIGWCIGLHAGWVFVIQLTRHLTDGNERSPLAFLVGSYDGMIGWLAAGWIGLLALVYWFFAVHRASLERRA